MPQHLKKISHGVAFWTSMLVLVTVGGIDFLTGPTVDVLPFYLLPLCIITWFVGLRAGVLMAIACSAVWLVASLTSGGDSSIVAYWNALATLCAFTVVAFLVHARRQLTRKVEELVAEKTVVLTAEVAERKRAEEAVHRLAAQLSAAEDAQRRQLARDIHDSLGQTLTVLKLNLEGIREAAEHNASLSGEHSKVEESLSLIEAMIQQTRTMTFELYPAMLDHLGLVPTIRRYAAQIQAQTGIQASVSEIGTPRTLPPHVSTYLFRAIKELINNARKHGQPREIFITVHWRENAKANPGSGGGMRVVVDDDGRGFDPARALADAAGAEGGLGLPSIRERISSMGGTTHIESALGRGTRIIIELPPEAERVDRIA